MGDNGSVTVLENIRHVQTTDPNRFKQNVQDSETDPQKSLIGSLNIVVEQGHYIFYIHVALASSVPFLSNNDSFIPQENPEPGKRTMLSF